MQFLTKIMLRMFGGRVRLIHLSEETYNGIREEMAKIGKMHEFWEMHKQIGYQFYAKSNDRRWLGYTDLAATMQSGIDKVDNDENEPVSHGYDSMA